MKIAFTSCFSAQSFKDQPVWDQIAASEASVLVLLGDCAYYDGDGSSMSEVKDMGADQFARHAFGRLRDQLHQPQFSSLVRKSGLAMHPIWDDHDFLWNGACGAQVQGQPSLRHLLAPTRAAFAAFRAALDAHNPALFPKPADPWRSDIAEPGYRLVDLGDKVLLHLTDGRSYKTRGGSDALLGSPQLEKMQAAMEAADPEAVHLVASGLVFEAGYGENWMACKTEHQKMLALAGRFRVLMLSGDIHENRFAVPYPTPGRWPMFEATSSGAALCTAVTVGALQCNWGLLNITPETVEVELSQRKLATRRCAIDRPSWTLRSGP